MKFILALIISLSSTVWAHVADEGVYGTLVETECGEDFNPMTVILPYSVSGVCLGSVVGQSRPVIVIKYVIAASRREVHEVFTVMSEKETETGAGSAVSSTAVVNALGQEAVFVKHFWNHQLVGLRGQTPSGVRFNGSKFHKF